MKTKILRLFVISLTTMLALLSLNIHAQVAGKKSEPGYRIVGGSITGASEVNANAAKNTSKLELASSDARLVEVFNWARQQAMSFVLEDDPLGPWYEAAEPGREAFCMRDVSHQAMGAHALGLALHNYNMLRRFAENVSDARDWCSFWEIDRYNQPATVDYKNDAEFWYNLPANFDVLDCCFRMYVWTGDRTYINDPVFLNFYDRTVIDYVERWGFGIDDIMKRPRLMNIRGMVDTTKKFQSARGIPGYNEGDHNYVLGFDMLATQYAAYLAYAHIQEVRRNGELALTYMKKADEVKNLATTTWWNEKEKCFYARLNEHYQLEGESRGGLDWGTVRHDNPDADNARLLDLSQARLEYPEVSFTRIGTIVNGTMGINLEFTSPLLSEVEGFWVETMVKTLSGLGTKIAWAELRNLPVRANEISVRHDGTRKTTLINQQGPAFIWQATFHGTHNTLLVNGRPMKALVNTGAAGLTTSSVRVSIGAGGAASVEIPKQ